MGHLKSEWDIVAMAPSILITAGRRSKSGAHTQRIRAKDPMQETCTSDHDTATQPPCHSL